MRDSRLQKLNNAGLQNMITREKVITGRNVFVMFGDHHMAEMVFTQWWLPNISEAFLLVNELRDYLFFVHTSSEGSKYQKSRVIYFTYPPKKIDQLKYFHPLNQNTIFPTKVKEESRIFSKYQDLKYPDPQKEFLNVMVTLTWTNKVWVFVWLLLVPYGLWTVDRNWDLTLKFFSDIFFGDLSAVIFLASLELATVQLLKYQLDGWKD